ncbi:MAG TPA: hypothetical protein HPP56_04375 [Nitrospirae bacterium]|nr:hypothetical protein [Nitrospirota bacterium]
MIRHKNKPIEYLSNTGPTLDIISPELSGVCKSPMKIDIKFTPKEGSFINFSSLKVELLKIIPIDITHMVKPYTTEKGILAENISLPKGMHKLKLTLCDNLGGKTQVVYNVTVV